MEEWKQKGREPFYCIFRAWTSNSHFQLPLPIGWNQQFFLCWTQSVIACWPALSSTSIASFGQDSFRLNWQRGRGEGTLCLTCLLICPHSRVPWHIQLMYLVRFSRLRLSLPALFFNPLSSLLLCFHSISSLLLASTNAICFVMLSSLLRVHFAVLFHFFSVKMKYAPCINRMIAFSSVPFRYGSIF